MTSTAMPQHRRIVIDRLYQALRQGELLTRSALSADTRLSGTMLGAVLDDLVGLRIVRKTTDGTPGLRGPKARYTLAGDFASVASVGFGHDVIGVVVTDLSGEPVEGCDEVTSPAEPGWVEREPTEAIRQGADLARTALEAAGISHQQLVGLGVSMPCPLMGDGRPYSGFMERWQSRNVAVELRRELGLSERVAVVIENDANLTALREHRDGAARGATHACVVKWGAGLGAGLIVESALYRGPFGLAGEIGHIPVTAPIGDPDVDETKALFAISPAASRTCPRCEQACLETLIGTDGLLRYLAATGTTEFPSIASALAAAEAHDVFRLASHLLGQRLGPVLSALNVPRLIVDAFGRTDAFPLVVDGLREGLREQMVPGAYQQLTVETAVTGRKAPVLGAADLVLDQHLGTWVRDLSDAQLQSRAKTPSGDRRITAPV